LYLTIYNFIFSIDKSFFILIIYFFKSKKIGILQDKISKTLIDALTDIQLEDAPLIVKTSTMGNKCVSCNQVLSGKQNEESNTNNNINNSSNFNLSVNANFSSPRLDSRMNNFLSSPSNPEKMNILRNLQEVSNLGSYSKILSNFDDDNNGNEITINLRNKLTNNINFQNLIHLPEVINKRAIKLNSGELKKHFRNKSLVIQSTKNINKSNLISNGTNTNNVNNSYFFDNGINLNNVNNSHLINNGINSNNINNSYLINNGTNTNTVNNKNVNKSSNTIKFIPYNPNINNENLKNYLESEMDTNKIIRGENLIKAVDRFHSFNSK